MDEAGIAERRPDAGPQPGDQPRAGVGVETGEDAAADRVHGDDPDRQPAIPYVFAAATQSAAGAGGDEQVVELAVELAHHFGHRRPVVRAGVGRIGVLVGPERVRDLVPQRAHALEARRQPFARDRVGLDDAVDPGAIGLQDLHVDRRGLGIHDADEAQAEAAACLGEGDPHVPGARFDHHGRRSNRAGSPGALEDGQGGSVLGAAARIQEFQLGKYLQLIINRILIQLDQGSLADGRKDASARMHTLTHE